MTSKLPWTPGPWRWENRDVISHEGGTICFTCNPRNCPETRESGESWLSMRERTRPQRDAIRAERDSNAQLISMTPELYECLEQFIFLEQGMDISTKEEIVERAEKALSKARGECG